MLRRRRGCLSRSKLRPSAAIRRAKARRITASRWSAESVLSDFSGLRRQFRVVPWSYAKSRPRVAHEKCWPGFPVLSEKQYQIPAGRARNCRFFLARASWPLSARFAVPRERRAISSPESRRGNSAARPCPQTSRLRRLREEPGTYRQNRLLAMRAPSASAANFAQTMSGSTAAWPTHVP
jgi:hypothetical protein